MPELLAAHVHVPRCGGFVMKAMKACGTWFLFLASATACGAGESSTPPPASAPIPTGTTNAAPPPAPPSNSESSSKRFEAQLAHIKGVVDAVNAHDAKKMGEHYAKDATLVVMPGAGAVTGREGIIQDQQAVFAPFPDMKMALKRVWQTEKTCIVESVYRATHSGAFMGIPASGRIVGQVSLSVYDMDDSGMIVAERLYRDDATLLGQLAGRPGVPPVPDLPSSPDLYRQDGSASEQQAVNLSNAMLTSWEKKNVNEFLGLLSPDFQYSAMMAQSADRGTQAAKNAFDRFATAFPDHKYAIAHSWGVGNFGILEYTIAGTHKGPIGPIPATNKPVNWHWVQIIEAKDGKIAHGWGYANMLELLAQIGALSTVAPTPAGAPQKAPPKTPPAKKK